MKKILSVVTVLTMIYSCSNNSSDSTKMNGADSASVQPPLDKQIIGEWHNASLKVKINTALNSDSTGYIDVDEANWERVLKTKPMKTVFSEDGSYRLTYGSIADSSVTASSGTWYVINDTIFMNQKHPDATFFQYHLGVKDNILTLNGLVDWEGDGKIDDEYNGTLKR
jgi:hypothetical protein